MLPLTFHCSSEYFWQINKHQEHHSNRKKTVTFQLTNGIEKKNEISYLWIVCVECDGNPCDKNSSVLGTRIHTDIHRRIRQTWWVDSLSIDSNGKYPFYPARNWMTYNEVRDPNLSSSRSWWMVNIFRRSLIYWWSSIGVENKSSTHV